MKWSLISPTPGDMIRVKTGSLYHYGVYVSDDEVIQFGLAPSLTVGAAPGLELLQLNLLIMYGQMRADPVYKKFKASNAFQNG